MRPAKRMVSAIASGRSRNSRAISCGRLEIAFGIGLEALADGIDRGLLADAGQHILQRAARGIVIQHLVGRQQRHACDVSDALQPRQTAPVVAAIQQARGQPHAIGAAALQPVQNFQGFCRLEAMRQRQNQKLPLGKFQEVIEFEMAFALLDLVGIVAALAAGEQLAQPAVGGAVARIDQNIRRAVDEDEARTDQKFWLVCDLGIVEFLVGPHHAGQRVVIGDADHGNTQAGSPHAHRRADRDPPRRNEKFVVIPISA